MVSFQAPIDTEAIKISAETVSELAKGSFSRLLYPAMEEGGLLFQDMVKFWRRQNAKRTAEIADEFPKGDDAKMNPLLACRILEAASFTDDPLLQNMWAGLLASSRTESGEDDSDILFVNILSSLTRNQAGFIDFLGSELRPYSINRDTGQFNLEFRLFSKPELEKLFRETNGSLISNHIFYLSSKELIEWKYPGEPGTIKVVLTPLAISFYARCQGWKGTNMGFFDATNREPVSKEKMRPFLATNEINRQRPSLCKKTKVPGTKSRIRFLAPFPSLFRLP